MPKRTIIKDKEKFEFKLFKPKNAYRCAWCRKEHSDWIDALECCKTKKSE